MQLFLVFLSTLATVAARKSSLRSASDMIVIVQETHYTFDVDSQAQPVSSSDIDDFVSKCLTESFNAIHNPTEYRIIAVDVESEIIVPDSGLQASEIQITNWHPFRYGYWGSITSATCRYCNPNLFSLEHDYPAWEQALCTCLQTSSDEALRTANQCQIERPDVAATNVSGIEVAPNVATSDMIVIVQETHYTFDVDSQAQPASSSDIDDFVSKCLTESFNAIHNPTEYRIIAVDVESEIIVPDSGLQASEIQITNWHPFRYGYWGSITSATCRYCNPNLFSLEHDYPAWEQALCTCLQTSSDEALRTANQCHIERPDITATNLADNIVEGSTEVA